jgi:Na+/melibiose symporter-like transporter
MSDESTSIASARAVNSAPGQREETQQQQSTGRRRFLLSRKTADEVSSIDSAEEYKEGPPVEKWSLGILNDKRTEEVPG